MLNKNNNFSHTLVKIQSTIDCFTELFGKLISWLVIILVLLVSYDVAMRYIFNLGSIAIQELEWHLFSLIFLLGAAYTLKHDGHVRLDLFFQSKYSNERTRAWINLIGAVVILIPFCCLVINSSKPFIELAFNIQEGSPDPGGLPYRWLLKSAIPFGFFLLLLQGLSEAIKNAIFLLEKRT